MKKLHAIGLALMLSSLSVGCASPPEDEAASAEDAVTARTPERKAQLDALRERVKQDFAGSSRLAGHKLLFVVRRLEADATRAVVFAHLVKADASGKQSELAAEDYAGSAYEEQVREGLFDGPEVTAALELKDGKWTVMTRGAGADLREAYVVGPTDVPWVDWDAVFGLPKEWLGLAR